MVHALQQAWRVLRPSGFLIDLRPIAVDTPLLIFTRAGWKSAGLPDQSPDRVYAIAADRAMRSVVRDGLFVRTKWKYFDINYYWVNLEDLKADIEERWKDDVIISDDIWKRARALLNERGEEKRIRIPFRKKINVYRIAKGYLGNRGVSI